MRHSYSELLGNRPWPRVVVIGRINLTGGFIAAWTGFLDSEVMKWGILALQLLIILWWWDMYRENGSGGHARGISFAIRYGMALFISSEILFFSAFFWRYFHGYWHPEYTGQWKRREYGEVVIDPFGLPFLNTLILLVSGIVVTMSHHGQIRRCGYTGVCTGVTMIMGVYFICMQYAEYIQSGFRANRSGFGTLFFILTGFHGLHVRVGIALLGFSVYRIRRGAMTEAKHVFHEAAAWYWHFVDVVWLGLYLFIYWYGLDGRGPTVTF